MTFWIRLYSLCVCILCVSSKNTVYFYRWLVICVSFIFIDDILNKAGRALRSTSNQTSEPCQVAQHPLHLWVRRIYIYIYTYICVYIYIYIYKHTHIAPMTKASWEEEICCMFCKRALITGLFCGKWPVNVRYSMGLRHPWQRLHGRRRSVVCTTKKPLIIGLFCGKWPVNIRHSTSNNCAYQNFMLCLVPSHESPRWVGGMTQAYAWHGVGWGT